MTLEQWIEFPMKVYEANSSAFYEKYNSIKVAPAGEKSPSEMAELISAAISTATLSVKHLVELRRKSDEYISIMRDFGNDVSKIEVRVEELNCRLDAQSRDIRVKKDELTEMMYGLGR